MSFQKGCTRDEWQFSPSTWAPLMSVWMNAGLSFVFAYDFHTEKKMVQIYPKLLSNCFLNIFQSLYKTWELCYFIPASSFNSWQITWSSNHLLISLVCTWPGWIDDSKQMTGTHCNTDTKLHISTQKRECDRHLGKTRVNILYWNISASIQWNEYASKWTKMMFGVPQGSRPILFNIYIFLLGCKTMKSTIISM